MAGQIGVVETGLGVVELILGLARSDVLAPRTLANQKPQHFLDVIVKTTEPALHGREPGAQILRHDIDGHRLTFEA